MKSYYISIIILLSCCGCTSTPVSDAKNIDQFVSLKVGSTISAAEKLLGLPSEKIQVGSGSQQWNYNYPSLKYPKLALLVDTKKNIVLTKVYFPLDNDPLLKLANAKALNTDATLIDSTEKKVTHYNDPTRVLSDAKLGFAIQYDNSNQRVESISWYQPQRSPANK